jgi:hypothetical protein
VRWFVAEKVDPHLAEKLGTTMLDEAMDAESSEATDSVDAGV